MTPQFTKMWVSPLSATFFGCHFYRILHQSPLHQTLHNPHQVEHCQPLHQVFTPSVGISYFFHRELGGCSPPKFFASPLLAQKFPWTLPFFSLFRQYDRYCLQRFSDTAHYQHFDNSSPPSNFSWRHHCSFRVFGIFLVGYFIMTPPSTS